MQRRHKHNEEDTRRHQYDRVYLSATSLLCERVQINYHVQVRK